MFPNTFFCEEMTLLDEMQPEPDHETSWVPSPDGFLNVFFRTLGVTCIENVAQKGIIDIRGVVLASAGHL